MQSNFKFKISNLHLDLRQTTKWGRYLEKLGWESVELKVKSAKLKINLRIKNLGIFGSIIKIQRPPILNESVLKEIEEVAKRKRAILVKMEPEKGFENYLLLQKFDYETDSWPTMPTKTIVLDLEKEIPESYTKSARYDLRKAEKENLKIEFYKTTDPVAQMGFYELFKKSAKGKFFVPSFEKDFVHKCVALEPISFIALIYKRKQKDNKDTSERMGVAGAFVAVVGDTAHYVHAGTTMEGKQIGAPYKLLFEISKKLKKEGVRYFDLDGVYDKRYPSFTKSWQGFTQFKSHFGGAEVLYPHSFVKYRLLPLKILAKLSGI